MKRRNCYQGKKIAANLAVAVTVAAKMTKTTKTTKTNETMKTKMTKITSRRKKWFSKFKSKEHVQVNP